MLMAFSGNMVGRWNDPYWVRKIWHKFQVIWISKTQVMDETVDVTRFSTDFVHARISYSKWA